MLCIKNYQNVSGIECYCLFDILESRPYFPHGNVSNPSSVMCHVVIWISFNSLREELDGLLKLSTRKGVCPFRKQGYDILAAVYK